MKVSNFIMLHHSAVSYDKNSDQFNANNKYHQAQWNFLSSMGYFLGYNYEISKKGKIRQARADGEETAACYQSEMNDGRCIHICMDGNFDIEKPMPAQIYALRDLMKSLVGKYKIAKGNIVFHRDYANKTCPGVNMEIGFIRSLAYPSVPVELPSDVPNTNTTKEDILKKLKEVEQLVQSLT